MCSPLTSPTTVTPRLAPAGTDANQPCGEGCICHDVNTGHRVLATPDSWSMYVDVYPSTLCEHGNKILFTVPRRDDKFVLMRGGDSYIGINKPAWMLVGCAACQHNIGGITLLDDVVSFYVAPEHKYTTWAVTGFSGIPNQCIKRDPVGFLFTVDQLIQVEGSDGVMRSQLHVPRELPAMWRDWSSDMTPIPEALALMKDYFDKHGHDFQHNPSLGATLHEMRARSVYRLPRHFTFDAADIARGEAKPIPSRLTVDLTKDDDEPGYVPNSDEEREADERAIVGAVSAPSPAPTRPRSVTIPPRLKLRRCITHDFNCTLSPM